MLIRFNKKSKPVEILTEEFDELVKKGKLTPKSLVKNKFIAKGKWVSIDNMESFHRKSPVEYPPGPYLIQSREIKDRRKKQKDEQSVLFTSYMSGKMIEQYLELIPVKNLCAHFKVPTASRLMVMPSFAPELVITLLFGLDSISINIIRGTTCIFDTIPTLSTQTTEDGLWMQTEATPFDIKKANKVSIELPYSKRIYPFNDISFFMEQAEEAVACKAWVTDYGVSYRHEAVSDRTNIDVRWINPSKREHPAQYHLISSYSNVVKEAKLRKGKGRIAMILKGRQWWQFFAVAANL